MNTGGGGGGGAGAGTGGLTYAGGGPCGALAKPSVSIRRSGWVFGRASRLGDLFVPEEKKMNKAKETEVAANTPQKNATGDELDMIFGAANQ